MKTLLIVALVVHACITVDASAADGAASRDKVEADTLKQAEVGYATETWLQPRRLSKDLPWPGYSLSPSHPQQGGIAGPPPPQANFLSVNNDPEADGPYDVVFTPDGAKVIVVHRLTSNLTIFNAATRVLLATVAVGDYPTSVAVTPNGQYAVTANVFGDSVSIVDMTTHTHLADVPITGSQPFRIAITPDSNFAVVSVINDAVNSSFSVIDLNQQKETQVIPSASQGVIGFYFTPESGINAPIFTQFALTPDGNSIVLPHRSGAQVVIYDRASGGVVANIATAIGPTAVDISLDGTVAVISHDSPGNAISKIDLTTNTLDDTFNTPVLSAQVVRITHDKQYALAGISNNVIFVNLSDGAIDATIFTGTLGDIRISHNGQYAFVPNFNTRVIDIASQTLVATIPFAACVEGAVSPVALKAVALNSRFREDIHFYSINGAASSLEGWSSTGPPPEGDAPRNLAIAPDGSVAIVCNNVSRNVAIIDMSVPSVRSYLEVGERPLAAAITPNGQYAVVCGTDSNVVRIIDLATDSIVASLPISVRPSKVRISPDSQWAYVLNIAGGDKITFIQLNGAASSIISQLPSGETGAAQGYLYTEVSGIELSPDGSLLGVAASFDNQLRLFDTATRTQIAAVPVGNFPMSVAFSSDNSRAYVANAFGDSLSIVEINGALSSTIATVLGIEFPLVVLVDGKGEYIYVGNTDGNNPQLHVIDASTNSTVAIVPLPSSLRAAHLSNADGLIYAAAAGGQFVRVSAAGAASALIDSIPLTATPSDMAFSQATKTAVIAQPIPDGVDVVELESETLCPADLAPDRGDGTVNVDDLLVLLGSWGPCPGCPADLAPPGGDGTVNVDDLLVLLAAWGPCE